MVNITTPLGYYYEIFYKNIKWYQHVCGLNYVTDPNYKPIMRTWFWMGLIVMFFVFTIYTLIAYDADTAWKAFSFVGLAAQGIVKYIVLLMHAAEINYGIQFLHLVYKCNAKQSTTNYASLMRWGKIAFIVMRLSACIILASCIAFIPINFVENFLSDDEGRLPMMQTYIFGIDEKTDIGYVILYVYHLIMLFLAGVGTCSVDLLLIMFVVHMCPLVELLFNMFEILNEAVKDPIARESEKLVKFFENIIVMHSDICEYLDTISNIYSAIIFCEVLSAGLSLCVTIFCLLTLDGIELYFLFTLMFCKLFAYCFLGTIVEIATDRLNDTLLASNWYLLPLAKQRNMVVMISRSQNPRILKAGTAPLNMDTFVSVVKTVYSVGMLLIQSVEGN